MRKYFISGFVFIRFLPVICLWAHITDLQTIKGDQNFALGAESIHKWNFKKKKNERNILTFWEARLFIFLPTVRHKDWQASFVVFTRTFSLEESRAKEQRSRQGMLHFLKTKQSNKKTSHLSWKEVILVICLKLIFQSCKHHKQNSSNFHHQLS